MIRHLKRDTLARLVVAALLAVGLAAPVATMATTGPVDKDNNAIMWGGAYDKPTWYSKVKNGDGYNSAANLQTIYYSQGRGITSANFNNTVDGLVCKNGQVQVNGGVVATSAMSLGRQPMPGSTLDHGLYLRPTSVSFVSNCIAAFVNMDGGVFHYAVLKSCGNPVTAVPVPTPTPKPTPKPTATPCPTVTPTPTPMPTPTPCECTPTPTPKVVQVVTPTPTPTGKVLGSELPATGPEAALGGAVGLSAIGVAARSYLRSRKSVLDALRGKINRK